VSDEPGGIPVVRLEGELDITRAPTLRRELMAAADNRDAGLVVDLGAATYLDSAAVNVLFELADGLARRQVELAIVVPEGGLVERVVGLVDLGSVALMHRSADAAVADIRDRSGG
jgi:anti-sigma B factor antagonist